MYRWTALLGFLGLAIATGVIVWSGIDQVLAALGQAGGGILVVALFHFVPLIASAAGWQILIPGKTLRDLPRFVYFMWIRAAVNNLMPVARIGGEVAAVRLMTASGIRQNMAIASTVVELTLSIATVFLFVLMGIMLFAMRVNDANATSQLLWGLVLSLPLLGVIAFVQKVGLFSLLSRLFRLLFRDKWESLGINIDSLDRTIQNIYRHKTRALTCTAFQFLQWVVGSGEVWLALFFLGHPVGVIDAVIIEALIQASVSAGFIIPGALGVQEAGILVFGGMLGLPQDIAAALAVIKRCRDILVYAPGLVVWQVFEGKKLFGKKR